MTNAECLDEYMSPVVAPEHFSPEQQTVVDAKLEIRIADAITFFSAECVVDPERFAD